MASALVYHFKRILLSGSIGAKDMLPRSNTAMLYNTREASITTREKHMAAHGIGGDWGAHNLDFQSQSEYGQGN